MTEAQLNQAERAAVDLAYRTLEYVSIEGKEPEAMMDCDLEMWRLAHTVLEKLGQAIPARQRSNKAWVKAIYDAKYDGQAA